MRKILIIGATSAIAEATAKLFAKDGDRLFLVGRKTERLAIIAKDLRIRGAAHVEILAMDINDTSRHAEVLSQAAVALGGLDTVLLAHGTLANQKACEASFSETLRELQTNCLSTISFLTHIANLFEVQKHGTIAVISSVAGDRGRQSNYVYGTAKAAINTFLQGLRNRLYRSGVHVLTIKPGFVDTPMTVAFKKSTFWATPDTIAKGIFDAIAKLKDVIYLPAFWAFAMRGIRAIPERIFKRLSL